VGHQLGASRVLCTSGPCCWASTPVHGARPGTAAETDTVFRRRFPASA